MKRILALCIALLMVGTGLVASAEEISAETETPVVMEGDVEAPGDGETPPMEGMEEAPAEAYEPVAFSEEDAFLVGASTAVQGMYFTGMWGNNTSDIDVRYMLHDYSPVYWSMQTLFELNPNVVVQEDVLAGYLDNGNKMYTITLQPGLTYNDGTPITAADYLFSLYLHASPVIKELGGNTTSVSYISGYEAFAKGETEVFAGLSYLDTYTFAIEIDQEYLPFFYEMGLLDCVPYPISVIAPGCEVADEGDGVFIRNIDAENNPAPLFTAELLTETILNPDTGYLSHPRVTSGPYQLAEYNREEKTVSFTINPRYKGDATGQRPSIDNVKLVEVIPETMVQELVDGNVQLLNKCVAAETIDEGLTYLTDGTLSSSTYPRMGFGFLTFACEKGPAQFDAVRQAIAYAFSTDEFCERYNSLNYGLPVYGYYGIGQWMTQMFLSPGTRPEGATPEETQGWNALSLEGLNTYPKNLEKAKALLVEDGWTLNADGGEFTEGTDGVRYKDVDGELMELTLLYAQTEDSIASRILLEMLQEPLASIGMRFEAEVRPFTEWMQQYYRLEEREFDAMYLATNFLSIFDPSVTYNTQEEYEGTKNTTGYKDEVLEELALDMRRTEPGDLLTYCQKWLAFQTYFNEKVPLIPLYSNVYFDFFTPELSNYEPNLHQNWPSALLYAYFGAAPEGLEAAPAGAGEAAAAPGEEGAPETIVVE